MSAPEPDVVEQVCGLTDLPGVAAAIEEAREACTRLRWHQALRRRIPEAAAESRVRGAVATALLEGAEPAGSQGTLPLVRDLVRGASAWPDDPDPVTATVRGAVQVTAQSEFVDERALRAPAQVLARLHLAAAAGSLPGHQVGRPRVAGETPTEGAELGPAPDPAAVAARMAGVAALLAAGPQAPALVVAALVHAEIATVRPFAHGNGLVARALVRAVIRARGLDPTGVAVIEAGHAAKAGADYRGALAAYAHGGGEGVRLWLLHCAEAAVIAAQEGGRVADAVLTGRLG